MPRAACRVSHVYRTHAPQYVSVGSTCTRCGDTAVFNPESGQILWSLEVLNTISICVVSKTRPWNLRYENPKYEKGRTAVYRSVPSRSLVGVVASPRGCQPCLLLRPGGQRPKAPMFRDRKMALNWGAHHPRRFVAQHMKDRLRFYPRAQIRKRMLRAIFRPLKCD